jgi:carbamoyl-phosphate synthase large subunit
VKYENNILVMAAGSPLGQSIYKALAKSKLSLKLYLADISEMAAGFYLNSNVTNIILPLVKSDKYFDELKRVVNKYNIDVIFPVISLEHDFFARHISYFNSQGIKVITPEKDLYDRCNNKYLSMAYLRSKGIKAPDSVLCEDDEQLRLFLTRNEFPVVMKPCFGASSNNVFVVEDYKRLIAIAAAFPRNYFVVQEYLPSDEEYTIGVYITRDRSFKKTFVIKRELKFGLSYKGEVIISEKISDYCLNICSMLGMYYSTNVQLRIMDGEPYAFEINPRLSSTTSVRAHFGFNEPEMIIWELFHDMSEYKCKPRTGKFMRYWEEVYIGEA